LTKIIEFRIGKGKTNKAEDVEEWDRKYLELTAKLFSTRRGAK